MKRRDWSSVCWTMPSIPATHHFATLACRSAVRIGSGWTTGVPDASAQHQLGDNAEPSALVSTRFSSTGENGFAATGMARRSSQMPWSPYPVVKANGVCRRNSSSAIGKTFSPRKLTSSRATSKVHLLAYSSPWPDWKRSPQFRNRDRAACPRSTSPPSPRPQRQESLRAPSRRDHG